MSDEWGDVWGVPEWMRREAELQRAYTEYLRRRLDAMQVDLDRRILGPSDAEIVDAFLDTL